MLKIIKTLFEFVVPFIFIFVVFPRIIEIVKEMLGIGEEKKHKRPRLPSYRNTPPPPPPRMIGSKRVYSDDGNSFTENGKSYTKSDELGWDIPWYKEDEKPKTEPQPKNKHFKKGVNPDFL